MRSLFCLSSLLRNSEITIPSLCKRVLANIPGDIHIIGHFPDGKEAEHLEPLRDYDKAAKFKFEEDPKIPEDYLGFTSGMQQQRHGVKGNLLQWLSMRSVRDFALEQCDEISNYDQIFWCRPDIYFWDSLSFERPCQNLHFPAHDSWGGLNDRFCYGTPDLMIGRMGIYDYFIHSFYPEVSSGKIDSKWNPEMVLKHMMEQENINYKLFTCEFSKTRRFQNKYYLSVCDPPPKFLLLEILPRKS